MSFFLRNLLLATFALLATGPVPAQTLSLDALLSQPVATELLAAPTGHRFAWVEDTGSRRNLWVGTPDSPARNLTGYTTDDGLKTSDLAWSPDARWIAFVRSTPYGADGRPANPAHNTTPNDPTVWAINTQADAAPVRIGLGHSPHFLPDGHLLLLRGGSIWVASAAELPTSTFHPLIEPTSYGSASHLTLSPNGQYLAFLTTRPGGLHQLAFYDLAAKTLTLPAPGWGRIVAPTWSPDGKQLAFYRAPGDAAEFAPNRRSPRPWQLEVLDLTTRQTHVVFQPASNQPGSVLPLPDNNDPTLAWTSTGNLVFFSEEGGWIHLRTVTPEGSLAPDTVQPGEVDHIALSPDRTHLLLADSHDLPQPCAPRPGHPVHCMAIRRPDPDALDQRRLDLLTLTNPLAPPLPVPLPRGAHSVAALAWSADGLFRAALLSDARRPMHPVALAADNTLHDLHPLDDPPDLPRDTLATPTAVTFPTTGIPEDLHAQLFLPPDTTPAPHPAVLYLHGGPRRQMQLAYPSSAYYSGDYAFNQYLASLGFVVLSLNYRSGLGYGLDFRQCLDCGAAGAAEYADVLAAQHYLATRADVDPHRIALWGGSYGGYLTALGLARNSNLFAAGVDFSGVHEWILERNRADWLAGTSAQKAAIAARAHGSSPMAAIDRWRSPVLLIHGDQDPDVNFAQTTTLAAALRARKIPVETLLLPGETHNFLLHRDWIAAFTAAGRFLTTQLQPSAAPVH